MSKSILSRIERLEARAKARADKLAKARNPRPYCGERESLTVRLMVNEATELRRRAEMRGVTLNQVASEVMRRGMAKMEEA